MCCIQADESHNHSASTRRSRRVARTDGPQNRRAQGPHHPRGVRKGPQPKTAPVPVVGRHHPGSRGFLDAKRLLPQMKAIADTGFLVAFCNRKDHHHQWAMGISERVTEPLLTCEGVLAETALQLRNSAVTLALVREGLVRSAFVLSENLARLAELAVRYADREPDLADLCLIRIASPVTRDYHGPRGFPRIPQGPPRGHPADPSSSALTRRDLVDLARHHLWFDQRLRGALGLISREPPSGRRGPSSAAGRPKFVPPRCGSGNPRRAKP